MDIFSATKRGKEDSIKKPLNYPEASVTEQKLQSDNQRELDEFMIFLNNLYVKFDFKINKCKYNCISRASTYSEVGECETMCSEGATKFSAYVDSRVGEMQQLLGECVANANTLHNTVDEIYYCYEMYNKGFKQLKNFIAEESMFY